MRVRWTTDAADDLERICDYIAESRPESARRVAQSVVERIGTLEAFPHLGRSGRVEGAREIAFPPLPFIAIYEVFESQYSAPDFPGQAFRLTHTGHPGGNDGEGTRQRRSADRRGGARRDPGTVECGTQDRRGAAAVEWRGDRRGLSRYAGAGA